MREIEMKRSHSSVRAMMLFFYAITLLIGLFACKSDDGMIKHPGTLQLMLKADTTSLNGVNTSKLVEGEFNDFLDENAYSIQILKGEDIVQGYDRYDKMPAGLVLEEGAYTIKAFKGDDKPADFLNPYFAGSTEFVIKEDMSTPLEITCKLANARVTVDYSDDFKEAYPTYNLKMNTEFMKDSLDYSQDETRAAYLQTGEEGTDLNLFLSLVRLEDTIINTYKPDPIAIKPQERVNLLFKTDGEALSGISLVVTLNNSLDGDSTLNVNIPDYTYKPVKEPRLTPEGFESGKVITPDYSDLSNKLQAYYINYIIPATVGHSWFTMTKTMEGKVIETVSYDLADDTDLIKAKKDGIVVKNGEMELSSLKGTKNGAIYLDDILAKLEPSEKEMTYEFTLKMADALPIPVETDLVSLILKPNKVKPSSYESSFGEEFDFGTITDGDKISKQSISFDVPSGFKVSELTIKETNQHKPEVVTVYDFVEDKLPQGIIFDKETMTLTFNDDFVKYLPMVIGSRDEAHYELTVNVVDRMDKVVTETPLKLKVKIVPVINIEVPAAGAWAWKSKLQLRASGLQYINQLTSLKFYISEDGIVYEECVGKNELKENTISVWVENLNSDIEKYYVKVCYLEDIIVNDSFIKETSLQIKNSNMDTWGMDSKVCTYGYGSNTVSTGSKINIPYPSPDFWMTNNNVTAGEIYKNASLNPFSQPGVESIPPGCFPTVVYEVRGSGKAAVIRSINASDKNEKARGELSITKASFTSRPSSVSFDYAYSSLGDEAFVANITLLSEDGKTVAVGSRPASAGESADYTTCIIPLEYKLTDVPVSKISILFASADTEDPQYSTMDITTIDPGYVSTNGTYTYKGVRAGSCLKIDNVTFNYREE